MSTPHEHDPQPSAEAIRLAVKLSGHTHCQAVLKLGGQVCDGCLGDAATIDRELALPQRNAALLLAQGVADTVQRDYKHLENLDMQCDELREALARIHRP